MKSKFYLPGVIDHELEVGLELVHAGVLVRLQLLLDLHDVNGIVHRLVIPELMEEFFKILSNYLPSRSGKFNFLNFSSITV